MNDPVHISEPLLTVLNELGISWITCCNCGDEVPNTPAHNVYFDFPNLCKGATVCNECLGFLLKMCMNPPQFYMSPKGPVRLNDYLVLPFSPNSWVQIKL